MKELMRQVAIKLKGHLDMMAFQYLYEHSNLELVESAPIGSGYGHTTLTAIIYSKAVANDLFNSLSKPTTRLILNTILQVYKIDFKNYHYYEIQFKEKAGSFNAGMIDGSSYHEEFGRWARLIGPPSENNSTDNFDEQDYIELSKKVLLNHINRIRYKYDEPVIFEGEDLNLMPEEFWTLDHIQHLILENCTPGDFFKHINKLHKLQSLTIKGSEVTGFPEEITLLQDLEHLEISHASLEAIPDSISSLKKLKLLDVSGNYLNSFPETIGELVHLEQISANGNFISSLPDDFRNLQTLSILELSSNDFYEFPEVISDLPSLTVLHLNHNRIVSVPASISNLKNLQELFLDNNRLASVPFSLSLLKKITLLNLEENPLTDMPEVKGKNQLELYSYLDEQLNPKPYVTYWDVPESFRVAFQQYLNFFSDFVYQLDGERVFFETQKTATGLQLSTKPTETLPIERINELLEAYVRQEKEFISSMKKFELEYELKLNRIQSDLRFAKSQLQQGCSMKLQRLDFMQSSLMQKIEK